ncbi:creatininase family protein [Leptospirillum ferriphilum]|jgi:creatinine amidohydrolase|uniref:creatininase family protein n=1 Tax=Leptospirillum ferriphilum TaxID=178606 RepID=UPI003EE49CF3
MQIAHQNWPAVEQYLNSRSVLLIPIGSTEQHGPNGLIGTDHLVAESLARSVGEEMGILVAPTLAYGMSHHHLAFPGSASLSPETLIRVIRDVVTSFARNGFSRFFFINGHGGNVSSIQAAFSDILLDHPSLRLQLASWWLMPEVTDQEKIFFGTENGHHATCGEVAVTWHLYPEDETPIPPGVAPDPETEWPVGPERYRTLFPDGRMGSNPSLSSGEKGKVLFEIARKALVDRIRKFLSRDGADVRKGAGE